MHSSMALPQLSAHRISTEPAIPESECQAALAPMGGGCQQWKLHNGQVDNGGKGLVQGCWVRLRLHEGRGSNQG